MTKKTWYYYYLIFGVAMLICLYNLKLVQAQQNNKDKTKEKELKQLIVYFDKDHQQNHYYPSEWIGDKQDLVLDEADKNNPYSGDTCIRIEYKAESDFGWAGIYWVNPEGNWGNERGGYDLRFAKKLTFWAKGQKGGEHIAVFKFGGLKGLYPDSDNHGMGPVVLTPQWKQYTIDVSKRNMRYIMAGFSFYLAKAYNRQGCIFYIDDIKYE